MKQFEFVILEMMRFFCKTSRKDLVLVVLMTGTLGAGVVASTLVDMSLSVICSHHHQMSLKAECLRNTCDFVNVGETGQRGGCR